MVFVFGDHTVDVERRELRRGASAIAVEPQVFDLLVYLICHRDQVVTKDALFAAVWNGRIVSDSTLTSRINAARRALGDDGERQAVIKTIPRRGFRFIADISESTSTPPVEMPSPPRQEVRFCTAADGVRIAYAETGAGPTLVKAANWLNHLEYDWNSPIWRPLLGMIATGRRLIRYDARGNGLSDWDVDDISFSGFVRDIESVVAATAPEPFTLFGISQGCAVAIAYAVRFPERVARLVLYGGFARGRRRRGVREQSQSDALLTLMQEGWGGDNPAFRQIFTSLFIPEASAEHMRWFNDLQRITTSPANAVRIRAAIDDIDITELLPQVKVPTLVLHCSGDAAQPFEEGRRLAMLIPGARFVALEGRNHVLLESDPGWRRFSEEFRAFVPAAAAGARSG